jgi:hypothetical protein
MGPSTPAYLVQLKSGDPEIVTHRVVAQGFDSDGVLLFLTRGDANDVADEKWVQPVQIKGELDTPAALTLTMRAGGTASGAPAAAAPTSSAPPH